MSVDDNEKQIRLAQIEMQRESAVSAYIAVIVIGFAIFVLLLTLMYKLHISEDKTNKHELDMLAIKAGLIQKYDNGHVVWTVKENK